MLLPMLMGERDAVACLGLIKVEDTIPLNMWGGQRHRENLGSDYFCPLAGEGSRTAFLQRKRNDVFETHRLCQC